MVESNEVISLFLASAVLVFLLVYHSHLRRIPFMGLLVGGFLSLYASLVFTVAEGLLWGDFFNFLEHFMNMTSAVLLALWVLEAGRGGKDWPWSS